MTLPTASRHTAWIKAALCALLLLTFMTTAHAQDTTGSISGTVTDASGAAVKGATVVVTNIDQNQDIRTLTTNGAGYFTAPSLQVGSYRITVTDAGFKTDVLNNLTLHVSDALTVDRQLVVGAATDNVTVDASTTQLNFENANVSTTINGTQMKELVLNNRNYEQLVALQPGVAYGGTSDQLYIGNSLPGGTTATVAFSVSGSRSSTNNWQIDGTTNVDRGSNLTLLSYPSVDAIAEFTTLRNQYTATSGGSVGGQINVITRSGTNSLHGAVYEFFRNDVFNANAWGNKNVAPGTPFVTRPKLRYNDFGGTVGGPVVIPGLYNGKDKSFFFFSGEYRRVINYASTNLTGVPTQAERLGNFAAPVCTSVTVTAGVASCATTGTSVTINPTAAAYIKDIYSTDGSKVPLPNGATDIHTLIANQRSVYNENQEIARIDHTFKQKLLLTGRMIYDSVPTVEAGGAFTSASSLPGNGGTPSANESHTNSPGHNYLGRFTYTLNSSTVIEGGYDYSYGAILSTPTGTLSTALSPDILKSTTLPFAGTLGINPTVSFTGGTGITSSGQYNVLSVDHDVFGQVTHTYRTHTFIAGATFNRYRKTENATTTNAGTFSFTNAFTPTGSAAANYTQSFANFLSGYVTTFTQANIAITPDLRSNLLEGFLQDNWKTTRRLTLNLGVRYSYFGQPVDVNNFLDNFDPTRFDATKAPTLDSNGLICRTTASACTGGVVPNAGADYVTSLGVPLYVNGVILATPGNFGHASPYGANIGREHDKNFAPRVGFAYDLFGDGKTALRGGFGIAYDTTLFGTYEQNSFANPPFVNTPTYSNVSFSNPAGGAVNIAVTPTPGALRATATDFRTPYTEQYSLGIQQQLAPGLVLNADYVGNQGHHLLGIIDINEAVPGAYVNAGLGIAAGGVTTANSPKLNLIRPYRGYNAINVIQNIFGVNYNSLQVQLQKRFKDKSLVDVNYTWSKALTDNQTDRSTAVQDRTNIRGEYGRAQIDRRHILTSDFVYNLPFFHEQHGFVGHVLGGFELSGIVAFNTGLPFTPSTSSVDPGGLGFLGASAAGGRPDQVGDPNSGAGLRSKTKFFNTAAFAAVPTAQARPGSSHRGVINGPGFERLDMGLLRNFKIAEGKYLQFRGEGYNVFNHTNFATIAVAQTTPSTFGTVTAARDNRILQVALKFNY